MVHAVDLIVNSIPLIIIIIDMRDDTNGAVRATSNNDALEGGNDRSGVILPYVPIPKDGKGIGNPIFTPRFLAMTKRTNALNVDKANTPKKIGAHDLKIATSLLFTTRLKNFGFSAKVLIAKANVVNIVDVVDKPWLVSQ